MPQSLTPYLCVQGAELAVIFYKEVFDAEEIERFQETPESPIGHVTLKLYGSLLYMSDEFPDMGVLAPITIGGSPVSLYLKVPDVDSVAALAAEKGASILREPMDQGHGDRTATLRDPFGHRWMLASTL